MGGKKMLNSCWSRQLSESLKNPARNPVRRLAIVGVGAELNGDDAAGILAVRKLKNILAAREDVLVLDSGTTPETAAGPLRKFQPDFVLFIDAAGLGLEPGAVAWLDPAAIAGASFSTHSFPISVFLGYLQEALGCEVAVLGIQPQQVEFGSGLSQPVRKAVNQVARQITSLLEEIPNLKP